MSSQDKKIILANNLKFYMAANGKTRRDICAALNLPYMTVSDWVNMNNYPRIDKLEMLADYFGVTLADLVEPHGQNGERRSSPPPAEPSKKDAAIDWIRNEATMEDLSEIFRIVADRFGK